MRMVDRRRRILLVDGQKAWLDFSKQTLQEAGYSVETASSPEELDELSSKPGTRFNLILVEMEYVKHHDGLLGRLSRLGLADQCIVVVFPTRMTISQMAELFRTGIVRDCVDKQYNKRRLLSQVEDHLDRCKSNLVHLRTARDTHKLALCLCNRRRNHGS